MLDQLLDLAKSQLTPQLQQEAQLSPSQINQSVHIAKDSFIQQMASEAMSGNLGELLQLFNGNAPATTSNPLISRLIGQFGGDLMEKMNIKPETATMIANLVIPFVMQKLASNETGKADSESSLMDKLGLDAGNIMGSLLGGLFS